MKHHTARFNLTAEKGRPLLAPRRTPAFDGPLALANRWCLLQVHLVGETVGACGLHQDQREKMSECQNGRCQQSLDQSDLLLFGRLLVTQREVCISGTILNSTPDSARRFFFLFLLK